jgi:cytochrome b
MNDERRVWDLPVRLFHWLLVLAVGGAWTTHALGVNYFRFHVWCGYSVLVLVAFRLLWGIVGTRHARFAHFVRGPRATTRYAAALWRGAAVPHAGHNPLGAWMILGLLLALLTQALLGLFGNDEIFNYGPLYGYVSNARSLVLTSLHRRLFYWILAAIALHVAAVVYHRVARREPLVRAMFTGRKPAAVVPAGEAIDASRTWLAVLIVVALVAALTWAVRHAPAPQAFNPYD